MSKKESNPPPPEGLIRPKAPSAPPPKVVNLCDYIAQRQRAKAKAAVNKRAEEFDKW